MSRRERSPQKKRNTENAENTEGHREEREEYVWKEQKKMPKEHFTFQPSLFLRSPYLKSSSVFLRVLCVLCVRLVLSGLVRLVLRGSVRLSPLYPSVASLHPCMYISTCGFPMKK